MSAWNDLTNEEQNDLCEHISDETMSECDRHGYGRQIIVWPDLTYETALSSNDIVGYYDRSNNAVYPILRLSVPMSPSEVRSELEASASWADYEAA